MTWHFSIYTLFFILNAGLSVWLAVMVWRHGNAPGVKVFSVMLLASAFWSFFHLFEVAVDQAWGKIFWSQVEYIGSVAVGPCWSVYTFYYRYRLKRFPARYALFLAIIPVATVVLVFTNNLHHLIWTAITPVPGEPGVLIYSHGFFFWLSFVYDHCLVLFGMWNVYQAMRTAPQDQKTQPRALLLGALIPIFASLLYVTGLSPVKGEDLTPFTLTVTGVIYLLAVLRFRLFDIRRVARAVIIDSMRDGMLVIDEKNQIVDVNPSALRLLNLSKAMLQEGSAQSLAAYPPILDAIARPQAQAVTVAMDNPPGLHLDIQVTELHDSAGKPAGKLVMLRDVSERLVAEQSAFATAIEQQRHKLLTQFIRDISHEFRTPLSVINTNLYLLEKSADPEHQQRRREVIQLQTKRLDSLISEMLMAAQINSSSPLELTRIDLNKLIETVTEEQQPMFAAKRQTLTVHCAKETVPVVSDVLMLQKALTNILQNACRYTSDEGSITVTAKSERGMATIEISDSGIGMSAETQAHIFERFFRADESHSTPGFGLGLPIAQTIIEKHHGQIDVASTLGAGSTFTIRLPQTTPEALAAPVVRLAAS